MRVSTENYEFAHGKKPRGIGMWAFDFGRNGAYTTEFVPNQMSLVEAKKWAIRMGRQLGADFIQVAS